MFTLSRTITTLPMLLLMSLTAGAAEMPLKAPAAPPPPPPFSWTGFYIGGNVGGTWAGRHWTDSEFDLDWGNTSQARFIGGGQVGFNYEFAGAGYTGGGFVIGAEAQFDWAENEGGIDVTGGPLGHTFQITSNDNRIFTAAARLGYAWDRALFYGKVGGGWVGNSGFTVTDLNTTEQFVGETSHTFSGWMAGVGVEYALMDWWSVKAEYDFIGLGSRTFVVPGTFIPALAGDTITSSHNVQLFKVGINWRFGWGGYTQPAVAAKY